MEVPEHRFETSKTFDGPAGNNYTELTALREKERLDAIKKGLIDDPTKPKALEDARVFRGTCLDMCPLYEREQREFQNDVKRWEINPKTNRIDKDLAVKAFHRPAAGNEQALPSDVRPPEVLSRTLDYLVQKIVSDSDPLDKDTHGFVRDRTRSIRQDFTLQNERGSVAIACHERIVRFHILSLHQMCGIDGFDAHQEMEQLRKTLQSLAEYYDDQRHGERTYEHEAEFRAYHIMTRLRDPDVLRHVQTLPKHIRKDPSVAHALRLYKYAQRSNEEVGRFKAPNSEGSYNGYTRFFQLVRSAHTSYAMACLCETQFNSVRKGALKSMRKAFIAAVKAPSVDELVTMLGCDDSEEVELQCEQYGVIVRPDEDGVKRIILNKSSQFDGLSAIESCQRLD
ncbi:protein of unknown function [Taphrina deformans PYCC 5710]|uniref:SAC3/GANP/THP3 conserved domain-containing protein n=1 Tax=Taphrina deformans (strain PYCC 5710 / ATCC 11124 / CBS 356.35 / IMI 108563 / JCM 9778 / NBRC 8474) TaxID=1097556 RepID=R4XLK3_TAPDE|nr:protein of unknown function [Taphrina deformans PYCC 5710]|eukprot:CCG84170.1 protein of unknown function [Taphrina deformans PYCC 5710]